MFMYIPQLHLPFSSPKITTSPPSCQVSSWSLCSSTCGVGTQSWRPSDGGICWWQPEMRREEPVEVGSWNPIIDRVLACFRVVYHSLSHYLQGWMAPSIPGGGGFLAGVLKPSAEWQVNLNFALELAFPETNSKFAPENRWLEYDRFLFGTLSIFRSILVSFKEGRSSLFFQILGCLLVGHTYFPSWYIPKETQKKHIWLVVGITHSNCKICFP